MKLLSVSPQQVLPVNAVGAAETLPVYEFPVSHALWHSEQGSPCCGIPEEAPVVADPVVGGAIDDPEPLAPVPHDNDAMQAAWHVAALAD